MKKVLKKFNRTLSIMLAAAMVLTMLPQTAMPVLAAGESTEQSVEVEPTTSTEPIVEETAETPISTENDEQISEEGGDKKPEEVTTVIETPEDAPAEEPADDDTNVDDPADDVDVDDPANDTNVDDPADVDDTTVVEEPVSETDETTADDMTVNAEGDTRTVTIENYQTLRDQIDIGATVNGQTVKIPVNGQITATEGASGGMPSIVVTLTDTANWKIQEVTKGGTKVDESSSYSISDFTEDTSIAVTVAAVYSVSLDTAGSETITVKDTSGAETPADTTVAKGTAQTIKKGDPARSMEFTVTGYDYTATDTKLKVYYSTDGTTDPDDREELTAVMTEEGEAKTKVYTYTVPADVIASLESSIKIVLVKEEAKSYKTQINALGTGDIASVKYQKAKAEGTGFDWAADGKSSAFVGETLNFQIALTDTAKAVKEIKGVTVKVGVDGEETPITCTPDAAKGTADCSFVVTEKIADAAQLTFKADIAYKEANRATLTYELGQNVDAKSVTAVKVKSVKYGTTAVADLDSLLGTTDGSLVENGKPKSVIIPKTNTNGALAEVVVEATIKGGYKVDEATGITFAAQTATYTFATGKLALTDALKATITTKVAGAAEKRYFTAAKAANADGIDTVVVTPASGRVTEKTAADNSKYWEVAKDVETVEVKVTADETKTIECDVAGLTKTMTAAAPSGKKVVYTVTLFASQLTGTAPESPQEITFTSKPLTFSATAQKNDKKEAVEGADVTMGTKATAEATTWDPYNAGDDITYGHQFHATVVPQRGYALTKVSYTVTDQFGKVSDPVDVKIDEVLIDKAHPELEASWEPAAAEFTIAKVQGDITITVETAKEDASAYKLVDPQIYTAAVDGTPASLEDLTDKDIDEIWQAEYGTTYVADVKNKEGALVPAKDVIVKVMDGGSAVSMTYPTVTVSGTAHRSFKLNKNLAGKEITVDVSVKEKTGEATLVGTYRMQVAPRASFITINGGAAIEQAVDQVQTYDIATDGQDALKAVVQGSDSTFNALITPRIDRDGNLQITTKPIGNKTEIATKGGTDEAPEWEYKKATIVVSNDEVESKVDITLRELFDPDAAPTLGARDNGDTVLNLTLGMAAEEPATRNSLKYVVTVAPDMTAATTDNPFPTEKLESSITVPDKTWKDGTIKLPVPVAKSENLGEGAAWPYKVTAKLVYTGGGKTFASKEAELDTATQALKFENNLKLKKAKGAPSALYTGQNEPVVIAEPQWTNKYSSYKITDEDIYGGYGVNLSVNAEGKIVVDSVDNDATVGKHTITVTAKADETGKGSDMGESHTMYASRATISVNVVKGINDLRVDVPSRKISKIDSRKAVTVKTNLIYNDSDMDYSSVWSWDGKKYISAPKSKKVKWSIVGADSYESDGVYYIKPAHASLNANTKNGVSVKNGTITIPKTYMPDTVHPSYNKFMVLVEADDFKGNDTKILSAPIEITADAIDLSNLAVVKRIAKEENEEVEDGYYGDTFKVIAVGGKQTTAVTADELNGAMVYALESPVTKDTVYSYAQWQKIRAKTYNGLVSFKSGNTKVLTVNGSGAIKVIAPNKKASITVNAEDGSKKKATLSLQIGYRDNAGKDLALQIGYTWNDAYETTSKDIYDPKKVENAVAKDFTATGAAVLGVQVMQGKKSDGTSTNLNEKMDPYTNYKLQAKGGKIVYQNTNTGYARVISTSKVTTLTLTDLNVAKGAPKKVYTYTLTNKAYDGLAKAPKVTVKGNLHEDGNEKEQTIKFNIADAAKGAKVKVEMDYSAEPKYNEKKPEPNWTFWNMNESLYYNNNNDNVFTVDENGDITVNLYSYYDYTPGSYKLKVTTGKGNNNSQFVPDALPATVSVKVVKDKAFTFKPTTTYTISKLDGGAVLTGKANVNAKLGEGVILNFNLLQNANLNGVSNKFTHYFTIEDDPTSKTQRLVLNKKSVEVQELLYNKTADGKIDLNSPKEDPVITIPKEDLTGYVRYTATPTVDYYTNTKYGGVGGTVKITVKIAPEAKAGAAPKASQKYVPQNAEISTKKDGVTQVNVCVNGAYVDVAYALIDESKAKSNTEGLVLDTANKSGTKDGQIVLKATQALTEGQKCTVNLLIIPESSMYKALIDKASDTPAASAKTNADAAESETPKPAAKTKADLIKFYGIPVKVTLVAKEKFTPTPSNKPVTNQVASVTVSSAGNVSSVAKGGTLQFNAVAKNASGGTVDASAATWRVTGQTKATSISATGLLRVAADETATSLTVTATIDGKSGSATVTVTGAAPTGKTASETAQMLADVSNWSTFASKKNDSTLADAKWCAEVEDNLTEEAESKLVGDYAGFTIEKASSGDLRLVDGNNAKATVKYTVKKGSDSAEATITIDAKVSAVSAVTINVPTTNQSVTKGQTVTCTAEVTGTNLLDGQKAVEWTIDGSYSGSSAFGTGESSNVFTVAAGETEASITLKATSAFDSTKTATVAIAPQD